MSESISWDFCNVSYLVTPKGLRAVRSMEVDGVPIVISTPSYKSDALSELNTNKQWSPFGKDLGRIIVKLRTETVKQKGLFTLYHELGHYVNKDYETFHNKATMWNDRFAHIQEGKVDPAELKADAYAASRLGKENTVLSLESLLKEIEKSTDIISKVRTKLTGKARMIVETNLKLSDLSIKEIKLRIEHIKGLEEI